MNNGLVSESLSSCAVFGILVFKKDGIWMMCVDCHVINKILAFHFWT